MLFILGASFFVLGVLTIWLYRLYIATGEYGLLAYFSGMLATAVFLWLSALLASRLSKKKAVPSSPKVRDALIATLQQDRDPRVRSAAAEGLAKLDLEESTEHLKHDDLDTILISTLQHDPDPRVRSAAAEGLAEPIDVGGVTTKAVRPEKSRDHPKLHRRPPCRAAYQVPVTRFDGVWAPPTYLSAPVDQVVGLVCASGPSTRPHKRV